MRNCATRPEVPVSIPGRALGNFPNYLIILSAFSSSGVYSACNRNEYQGNFVSVKCDQRVELTAVPYKLCPISE